MRLIFEQYDNSQHLTDASRAAVNHVTIWSAESPNMKPLNARRMDDFRLSIFGFDESDEPVSHAAITSIEDGVAHIGGYVVNEQARGRGVGRKTLQAVTSWAIYELGDEIESFEAYVNPSGLSQFTALGGQVVGEREAPDTGCTAIVSISKHRIIDNLIAGKVEAAQ
jgi:hypothetical protein